MPEIVTASLTINFEGSKGTNQFSVEVDDRADGPNAGRTTFLPGDAVYLLLFAGDNITNIRSFVTSGSLVQLGTIIVPREEVITFEQTREASSRYPVITGTEVYEWYGPSPAGISTADGKFLLTQDTLCIGKVKYNARATQYILSGVSYPAALALFVGEAP